MGDRGKPKQGPSLVRRVDVVAYRDDRTECSARLMLQSSGALLVSRAACPTRATWSRLPRGATSSSSRLRRSATRAHRGVASFSLASSQFPQSANVTGTMMLGPSIDRHDRSDHRSDGGGGNFTCVAQLGHDLPSHRGGVAAPFGDLIEGPAATLAVARLGVDHADVDAGRLDRRGGPGLRSRRLGHDGA